MIKDITDWRNPSQVTKEDFYVLAPPGEGASGHNIYVEGHGYLTDHIPDKRRRDNPTHWDEIFQDAEVFKKAWEPRHGPLELVYNLALEQDTTFHVVNTGAGTGAFTADLSLIEGTHITHIDFSETANRAAENNVTKFGNPDRVEIITAENRECFRQLKEKNLKPDFIFIYGGLGENTPREADIEETLSMAANILKPGGHIWYVGLEQPFLEGEGQQTVRITNDHELPVTDILGEFPTKPGFIRYFVLQLEDMYLVRDTAGPRPDDHPLRPGGPNEKHAHVVYRGLFAKHVGREEAHTPNFDFKTAVDPDWPTIWKEIIA